MNDNTVSDAAATGMGAAMILFVLLLSVGMYLFLCYCCKRICEKTGHTPGVLIWIPIVQFIPLLRVAGMAEWMLILMFIPFVNIVVIVYMWAKICQARGKSPWLVVLLFIPLANLVFIPYLAFAD